MTAGTTNPIASLSLDDLQETCPRCGGSGHEPVPQVPRYGGVGRRVVQVWPGGCPHPQCRGGKIPTAAGKVMQDFLRVFGRP